MFDVAIVGAGPAGATLARLIAREYKVLLLDKRHFSLPSYQAKCCGGLLAPDAQQMLAKLGLGVPQEVLTGPQLFVVRAVDLNRRIKKYYQRHYINIDRGRFDQWLVSLLPRDVDFRPGSRLKSFSYEYDTIQISFERDGKTCTECARILVGADGANSEVRRTAFPGRPAPKTYMAYQEWFSADKSLPYFSSIFDNEITDFYSWIIPKDGHLILGTAVHPVKNSTRKFDLLKQKLQDYGFRFGRSVQTRGTYLFRPVRMSQIFTGDGTVALIGESAGWISPSSAEGMSYAFRSATLLAESLLAGRDSFAGEYRSRTGKLRLNIFLKNLKSNFLYTPWLRRTVMNSGLKAISIKE